MNKPTTIRPIQEKTGPLYKPEAILYATKGVLYNVKHDDSGEFGSFFGGAMPRTSRVDNIGNYLDKQRNQGRANIVVTSNFHDSNQEKLRSLGLLGRIDHSFTREDLSTVHYQFVQTIDGRIIPYHKANPTHTHNEYSPHQRMEKDLHIAVNNLKSGGVQGINRTVRNRLLPFLRVIMLGTPQDIRYLKTEPELPMVIVGENADETAYWTNSPNMDLIVDSLFERNPVNAFDEAFENGENEGQVVDGIRKKVVELVLSVNSGWNKVKAPFSFRKNSDGARYVIAEPVNTARYKEHWEKQKGF